ncbi:MAG: UDP-N-acetylmuramoyl-tripeptide--D-alanyl-D-alanine ligase [Longimicrobiales bacterium]
MSEGRTAFPWTDRAVREALGMSLERADDTVEFAGVGTDSRSVAEGDLFVALTGDRFDGHDFVADAAAAGATGAVVSRPVSGASRVRLYPVQDTLVAFGKLARHRRRALRAEVVGITGSSGKTTTKELLKGALRRSFRVHATPMNYNNRVGLPRTLLDAPQDVQVVVVEMGTNEPGEIEILTGIAEPGYGVITTVGEGHLEKLGSVQGVFEEKLSLIRGLKEPGVGVVSDQPPVLPERAREIHSPIRVAGWSERADEDLRPGEPEADSRGCFHFRWKGETVTLRIPGRHAVLDALLALAVADELGVEPRAAARGVGQVESLDMRGEIRSVGSLTVILDCYNANPESVRASLELLASHPELGERVAVLGSMLELGKASARLHEEVLQDALDRPLDLIVAVGHFAVAARTLGLTGRTEAPRVVAVDEVEEAYPALLPELEGGEIVLLKASRGVELERLVPLLEWDFGTGGGTS